MLSNCRYLPGNPEGENTLGQFKDWAENPEVPLGYKQEGSSVSYCSGRGESETRSVPTRKRTAVPQSSAARAPQQDRSTRRGGDLRGITVPRP